jgi:hypothetical protein
VAGIPVFRNGGNLLLHNRINNAQILTRLIRNQQNAVWNALRRQRKRSRAQQKKK